MLPKSKLECIYNQTYIILPELSIYNFAGKYEKNVTSRWRMLCWIAEFEMRVFMRIWTVAAVTWQNIVLPLHNVISERYVWLINRSFPSALFTPHPNTHMPHAVGNHLPIAKCMQTTNTLCLKVCVITRKPNVPNGHTKFLRCVSVGIHVAHNTPAHWIPHSVFAFICGRMAWRSSAVLDLVYILGWQREWFVKYYQAQLWTWKMRKMNIGNFLYKQLKNKQLSGFYSATVLSSRMVEESSFKCFFNLIYVRKKNNHVNCIMRLIVFKYSSWEVFCASLNLEHNFFLAILEMRYGINLNLEELRKTSTNCDDLWFLSESNLQ